MEEFNLLTEVRVILALGKLAFDSVIELLQLSRIATFQKKPQFQHGTYFTWGAYTLLASYHPSQQNTQTGRLTKAMWTEVFDRTKTFLDLKDHTASKRKLVRTVHANKFDVPSPLRKP